MRSEAGHQFIAGGAERRAVSVGDEVIHGQVMAAGREMPPDGGDVTVTVRGIDGAEFEICGFCRWFSSQGRNWR